MPSPKSSHRQILKVDILKRVRVPKARREAILDEFERSGLSGAAFAKLHDLKYSTFASWSLKRRKNPSHVSSTLSLAEIIVEAEPRPSWPLQSEHCLHLPGGAWIELNGQADQAQLVAQLLNALQA
jgi:hypothetical protein